MSLDDALDQPERLAMRLYADVLDGSPLQQALGRLGDALGGGTSFATRVFLNAEATIPVGRFIPVASDPGGFDPVAMAGHVPAVHSLVARFAVGQGVTGIVAARRPLAQAAFGPREEALMTRLYPHLKRAMLAELRLADVQALSAATGLDRSTSGVAVLDGRGRLHFVNATLARFLAMRDGLALGANGPQLGGRPALRLGLRLDDPAVQRALDAAVRRGLGAVAKPSRTPPDAAVFEAGRPSGLPPWRVQVLPLRRRPDGPFAGLEGVVLIVTDPGQRRVGTTARLQAVLGLSPAEAVLAAALATGATLADHARARGVSLETVRSQMASIRRKTGCRRQAELVALVSGITAQIAIA